MRHHLRSQNIIGATLLIVFVLCPMPATAEEEEHADLVWKGPGTCLECHTEEAHEVHGSVMYQWHGRCAADDHRTGAAGQDLGRRQQLLHQHSRQLECLRQLPRRPRRHAAVRSHQRRSSRTSTVCSATSRPTNARRSTVSSYPTPTPWPSPMDEAVRTVHVPERAQLSPVPRQGRWRRRGQTR